MFPIIDTWRTQHRIHVGVTALMVVLAIFIGAGFWIDNAARWLSLGSAALGFTSIALTVLWLERS